jgi:hypothetical protein
MLRLRATFLAGRLHREMDEEMRAHVEQATARYMARGMSTTDARVAHAGWSRGSLTRASRSAA